MREIKAFTFEPGDNIEFELTPVGDRNVPRWNSKNRDTGYSGNWTEGSILKVTDEMIEITYEIENFLGLGICQFPNIKNVYFDRTQWVWPGYMRHTRNRTVPVCECGGAAAGTTHSRWCPAYK